VKRSPLERHKKLRKGDKGLQRDPQAQREWMFRSRRPLPPKSERRVEEAPERRALVERMLRKHPYCAAKVPMVCTKLASEVNEIVRRSQWPEGYLIKSNCESLCHNCHAIVTVRIDWAKRHGHLIEGAYRDDDRVRTQAFYIRIRTAGRCDVDCEIDHREEHVVRGIR
jgi:hypothetical protein